MIIAHIHPPSLIARKWVLHPDYGDQVIKTRSTYLLDAHNSEYCKNNDVIFYDVGQDYNLISNRLDSFVDKSLLDKIKNKKALLAIDQTEESFYIIPELIYKHLIIEQELPAESILLICHSFDMVEKINELSNLYKLPKIKCEFYGFWERQHKLTLIRTMNSLGVYDLEKISQVITSGLYQQTTKKYLSLNNTWREHRFALLCLLESKNLLGKGHLSFSLSPHKIGFSSPSSQKTSPFQGKLAKSKTLETKEKEALDNDWNHWIDVTKRCFPKIANEIEQGTVAKNRLPMLLDSNDMGIYLCWVDHTYLLKYFKNSYFSIVTETGYMTYIPKYAPTQFLYAGHTSPRYISEKVFKSIGSKHPFLFASLPNSLEIFNRLGYKTFEDIIDQSYDQEYDDSLRLLKIANETERLSNLRDQDLEDFKNKCKPIVEHNFETFLNRQNYIIKLI